MIEPKTVLILGAGASHDYGFPLGDELIDKVLGVLGQKKFRVHVHRAFNRGFPEMIDDSIDKLSKELLYPKPSSIDKFIIRQKANEKNIIRMALGKIILDCEKIQITSKSDWYSELYNTMSEKTNCSTFGLKNNVSIITFNYDRSLEQFLYLKLTGDYGRENDEVIKQQLTQIKVHHVHGKVGDLPWENKESGILYGAGGDNVNLMSIAKGLEVMGENDSFSDVACSKLEDAQFIYFIGFGYHFENLQKLYLNTINHCPNVMGTCQGIGRALKTQKENYFENIKMIDKDAFRFMKEDFYPMAPQKAITGLKI